MAAESLSRYLAWWDMLTRNGKLRLSDLPHLAPIVRELEGLIAEARELQGLIQENAEEELVLAPDRPPGGDATAEGAEGRIHRQRRGQRRDVPVVARKSINRRTTRTSGRAQD